MPLDAIGADLHLVATGEDAVAFALSSANGLHWIGAASFSRAPGAIHAILSGFAEMRRTGRSDARRLRDLEPDLLRDLIARAALEPAVVPPRPVVSPRAGVFRLEDGQAILLALPFGRCSADQLARAAAWSERFGASDIRLSFTRGLMLPRIADEQVPALIEEALRFGFITDAGDPRLSLLACPGKPDCGSALTSAPADALRIAQSGTGLLARGTTLHVSGCPKGCAHPGKANLTLVGRDDGHYDLVPNGSTRDAASLTLSIEDIMARLLPLKSLDDLRRAFSEQCQ
jgi:precorrin-3B synthase